MTSTTPLKITRSDPGRIEIEWDDGHRTVYTAAELRRLCPCAMCVDELSGRRTLEPKSIPDELTQLELRLVGNYAISVRFQDGHDTGIFPFGMLRDNDPVAP
jgi:ATP-binding protein involved in chromosome partitioning